MRRILLFACLSAGTVFAADEAKKAESEIDRALSSIASRLK